jgi:hypothetical protein
MKTIYYSILAISFLLIACKGEAGESVESDGISVDLTEVPNEDETVEAAPTVDELDVIDDTTPTYDGYFIIMEGTAGNFSPGNPLPEEGEGEMYAVQKVESEFQEEGETYIKTEYKVKEAEDWTLTIGPDIWGEDETRIGDIIVIHEKYKTEKGICVGSTIEEFIAQYDDYKISWSYISDRYLIETPYLKNVQFELNGADYPGEPDFDSDETILSKEDFKAGAQIQSIRIF